MYKKYLGNYLSAMELIASANQPLRALCQDFS